MYYLKLEQQCFIRYKDTRRSNFQKNTLYKGPDTPDAIRQRDAIFRFSLTDNFDPSLNFPNI
jgi:hypothetical protein